MDRTLPSLMCVLALRSGVSFAARCVNRRLARNLLRRLPTEKNRWFIGFEQEHEKE